MSDDSENPFNDMSLDEQPDETPRDESTEEPDDGDEIDPIRMPAFGYQQEHQRHFYALPEPWGRYEDLVLDAQFHLRKEYGLRDVPKSELQNAALRVLLDGYGDDAKKAAEYVVNARQENRG